MNERLAQKAELVRLPAPPPPAPGTAVPVVEPALPGNSNMERVAEAYWKRGDITALRALLDALPDAVILARPRLCLFHAWVRLIAGRFQPADDHV